VPVLDCADIAVQLLCDDGELHRNRVLCAHSLNLGLLDIRQQWGIFSSLLRVAASVCWSVRSLEFVAVVDHLLRVRYDDQNSAYFNSVCGPTLSVPQQHTPSVGPQTLLKVAKS